MSAELAPSLLTPNANIAVRVAGLVCHLPVHAMAFPASADVSFGRLVPFVAGMEGVARVRAKPLRTANAVV